MITIADALHDEAISVPCRARQPPGIGHHQVLLTAVHQQHGELLRARMRHGVQDDPRVVAGVSWAAARGDRDRRGIRGARSLRAKDRHGDPGGVASALARPPTEQPQTHHTRKDTPDRPDPSQYAAARHRHPSTLRPVIQPPEPVRALFRDKGRYKTSRKNTAEPLTGGGRRVAVRESGIASACPCRE